MASVLYRLMSDPASAQQIMQEARQARPMLPPPMPVRAPVKADSGEPSRTQDIGQIGANPLGAIPVPRYDGGAGEDVTPLFRQLLAQQQAPGSSQQSTPTIQAPSPAPSPQALQAPPVDDGRGMLRATAQALIARGTPAQRVQGLQMLFEASQPTKQEQESAALQKQLSIIEQAPADEEAKARARTLVQLGGKTSEIAEALGFDDKGAKARHAQTKALVAAAAKQASDAYAGQTLKAAAADAINTIDTEWAATGYSGAIASSLPVVGGATAAGRLESTLAPIKSLVSMDRLQQLKEQSATGSSGLGALSDSELRLIQSSQGALDITLPPDILKRNIKAIVGANDIFTQLRALVPSIEAGDAEAAKQYVALSAKLGQIVPTIKGAHDDKDVMPDERGTAFEQKYGIR